MNYQIWLALCLITTHNILIRTSLKIQLGLETTFAVIHYNYLQLLYEGIVLYQGLQKKFAFKTSRAQRDMLCRQNWSREALVK